MPGSLHRSWARVLMGSEGKGCTKPLAHLLKPTEMQGNVHPWAPPCCSANLACAGSWDVTDWTRWLSPCNNLQTALTGQGLAPGDSPGACSHVRNMLPKQILQEVLLLSIGLTASHFLLLMTNQKGKKSTTKGKKNTTTNFPQKGGVVVVGGGGG